jgi:hypothetical protein
MTDHYGDHYASKIPENGVLMPPSPPLMETPQKVGSPAVSASMYCSSPVLSLYEVNKYQYFSNNLKNLPI